MKWWKPKHSVCEECGVYFEPLTGYEARWGHLCALHRKPVKERDEKKDAVIAWAAANLELIAKIMEEETADQRAAYNKIISAQAAPYPGAALNQCNNALGGLGVLGTAWRQTK